MRRLWPAVVVAACVTPRALVSPPPEPLDAVRLVASLRAPLPLVLSDVRRTLEGGTKGDVRAVYQKVAPATVVVRSAGGFGTGVIVDDRGYVLTNHHVVARPELVDLKPKVRVQLGRLIDGVMRLEPQPLDAWVVADDEKRDLALLRLVSPPAELPVVKLARVDPSPGTPVAALGHGAIGLLWAIKDGEVASVGKLSTHLASVLAADCGPNVGCVTATQRALDERMPARVVQSSCPISPGDSGGPLVNLAGELVGLNAFLKTDSRSPVAASFHVHVSELRDFVKHASTEPAPRVPEPWGLIGAGAWVDVDGDATNDLFVSSAKGREGLVVTKRAQPVSAAWRTTLAADAIVAHVGNHWLGWFDLDGDGRFDELIVEGSVGQAWRLHDNRPKAFLGAATILDSARLAHALPHVKALMNVAELSPPTLEGFRAHDGLDLDRDGKPDVYVGQRGVQRGYFIDADQRVAKDMTEAIVRVVTQPGLTWAFLGERRAFLAREGSTIERAWLRGERDWVEAPQYRAMDFRALVLLSLDGAMKERTARAFDEVLQAPVQKPRPFSVLSRGAVSTRSAPGLPFAIVTISDDDASTVAFALDDAEASAETRRAWAVAGFPGAGFVWASRGESEWLQYDTDGDGQIDAAIVRDEQGLSGRRITAQGTVSDAPELARGQPVKPSLLLDPARRARFSALAAEAFSPEAIEP